MWPPLRALALPGAVLLLAALMRAADAQLSGFSVQGGGVRIVYPPGHRTTAIDFALADFGKPLYGGVLT
jgi:hypothetical protein